VRPATRAILTVPNKPHGTGKALVATRTIRGRLIKQTRKSQLYLYGQKFFSEVKKLSCNLTKPLYVQTVSL